MCDEIFSAREAVVEKVVLRTRLYLLKHLSD